MQIVRMFCHGIANLPAQRIQQLLLDALQAYQPTTPAEIAAKQALLDPLTR